MEACNQRLSFAVNKTHYPSRPTALGLGFRSVKCTTARANIPYRILTMRACGLVFVTLVNCASYLSADRGVHATCFYFTRCALNLLCLDLRVFSVVPCTVHSDLAYAAYSYSSGSFLTVLVLSFFCIFSFYVFSCLLSFCCVSTLSSVLCRIVVYVRCFVWYPCCFCVFGWCLCILGEAIVFFSCDCFGTSLSLYCEK